MSGDLTPEEKAKLIESIEDHTLIGVLEDELAESERIEHLVTRQGYLHQYDLSEEQLERLKAPNGLIKLPSDRELNKAADLVLKEWAKVYRATDMSTIARETGALRKGPSKRSFIELDDPKYEKVNLVVKQMTEINMNMLFMHYVDRRDEHGDPIAVDVWVKRLKVSKSSYNRTLRDAKYEFVVRGGLQ